MQSASIALKHASDLQSTSDFLYFKDFELIAFFNVIEILQ
jgi:hypothetical protein